MRGLLFRKDFAIVDLVWAATGKSSNYLIMSQHTKISIFLFTLLVEYIRGYINMSESKTVKVIETALPPKSYAVHMLR